MSEVYEQSEATSTAEHPRIDISGKLRAKSNVAKKR